jgi:hypothetical protein
MSLRILTLLGCLLAASPAAPAGETTWQRNAPWLQEQIGDCAGGEDLDACRYFPARALDRLFGIERMCQGEACANHWQVAETVLGGDGWTELGNASDQAALTKARDMATGGMPVVAIYGGMVALVMPGKAFPSQRWSRNVPLAVGARVDQPDASIYGKGLNFLFSEPETVTLYVHK